MKTGQVENRSKSVSALSDLELLFKVRGVNLARLSKELGCDRTNLSAGIKGRRSIPRELKSKLHSYAGLIGEDGLFDSSRVHTWHLITTGRRRKNIDEFLEASKRFFDLKYIGPVWSSADTKCKQDITVLCNSYKKGRKITDVAFPGHPIFICVVQDSKDRIALTPDILERYEWLEVEPAMQNVSWDFNQAALFSPDEQVLPVKVFNQIINEKITRERMKDLFSSHNIWTWDRVAQYASELMSPYEAAERLGLNDLIRNERAQEE